jgi:hypothetical protein
LNFTDKIYMGTDDGETNQQIYATAIGYGCGQTSQGTGSISIGKNSGNLIQREFAVAIGHEAGFVEQRQYAISLGYNAGNEHQSTGSIAIGKEAGLAYQFDNAIAIGTSAGRVNMGTHCIAIGSYAGENSINSNDITPNNIVINATGSELNNIVPFSTVIKPLRTAADADPYTMMYYPGTGELTYSSEIATTDKTFVIDHPLDSNKYLVHACLEGPESGVYYRGSSYTDSKTMTCTVNLPDYVSKLAFDFTVNITPSEMTCVSCSDVDIQTGSFTVKSMIPTKFFWHVYGSRSTINSEPLKLNTKVVGDGPYKYIM